MKTIILYTRRNVGMYALSYLVANNYNVEVITDDENVLWLAKRLYCDVVDFDSMSKEFSLFLCVHGNKIIDKKYLDKGRFVNIHPCLSKYRGHNPIKRYIENKDTEASVESHWMTEEVDGGEVICRLKFKTTVCNSYADFYNQCVDKYFKIIHRTLELVL